MAITLYDLCGRDERLRFSPYCWRVRMALAHKGLDYTTVAWRFQEKEELASAHHFLLFLMMSNDFPIKQCLQMLAGVGQRS